MTNKNEQLENGRTLEYVIDLLQNGPEDPFEELYNMFTPLIHKEMKDLFIRGYDQDDFIQEARIVLYKAVMEYKPKKEVSFGVFYKSILSNEKVSMIRHDNAQKRQATKHASSLEDLQDKGLEYVVKGTRGDRNSPEALAILNANLEEYFMGLSSFEQEVFLVALKENPEADPRLLQKYTFPQIKNANDRCRKKLKENILK
ncbi:sigma-70 family RNA polymerase sigma factor [Lacticigenium naphthae]|uniref:sigma-70 family RNA polymerase sigma factor n=1 Tax=Lacticigenium naphthae TaxID=515351 RepID=UPI000415B094|nr:sigma-70 family RNA polymerase sigma factor [Lacticigenium naphthae]